jgi:hypothetical protein
MVASYKGKLLLKDASGKYIVLKENFIGGRPV